MRALLTSCLLHLVLGLLWFAALFPWKAHEEIPVEITTERIRATEPPRPTQKLASPPIRAIRPAPRSPEPAPPSRTAPPAGSAASPETTPLLAGESLAEEHEVSELPVLLNEVRVPYPPQARARGQQGAVVFDLVVDSRGRVRASRVVKSPAPELTDAARAAVERFIFRPARIGDKAVAIEIRYTYRFILE